MVTAKVSALTTLDHVETSWEMGGRTDEIQILHSIKGNWPRTEVTLIRPDSILDRTCKTYPAGDKEVVGWGL